MIPHNRAKDERSECLRGAWCLAAITTTRMNDSGVSASTTAAFAHYERIPLTRDSAKLLEIEPERPPRVVEQTIDQIKNPRSEPAEK